LYFTPGIRYNIYISKILEQSGASKTKENHVKRTSKYRKFNKNLLAKGYPEKFIFDYYQEADNQDLFETDTLENLEADFELYIATVREMMVEDPSWSKLYLESIDRALAESKQEEVIEKV